jgi:putative resolvase
VDSLPEVLRPGEVANLLRITLTTLRKWDRNGSLRASVRSAGGHRRYARADVLAFLGKQEDCASERTAAIYARVNTAKQAEAGNLERQRLRLLEYAAVNGYHVVLQTCDVASGLNTKRRGLQRIVAAARKHEIRFLVVEYPDRLARFGFAYLEELFDVLGVRVVIASPQEPEDAHTELVKDLLAIVTSFSAKLYGMRGGRRARANVKETLAELERAGGLAG